ncbi:unnamed protein product [Spirodela intermedia]|uniref:Uncharacterized protein n=1 Tax=Spirodela intermedia TaxID=51605 RepID=A0A7I8JWU2_SPIIN|nr:unnamed protein product [Spirodela intermedia]
MSRTQAGSGTAPFSGLRRIQGFTPPRAWPTYPKVDWALVTSTSANPSRFISAHAFMSWVLLPVFCHPS